MSNVDIDSELIKARETGDKIREKVILSGKWKTIDELNELVGKMKALNFNPDIALNLIPFPKLPQMTPVYPKHEFNVLGFRERALFKLEFWKGFLWIGLFFFLAIEIDYDLKRWDIYLI